MKLYCSATKLLEVSKLGFTALPMTHVFEKLEVEVKSLAEIELIARTYYVNANLSGKAAALSFFVRKGRGERKFNGMDKLIDLLNRQLRFANEHLVKVNE